MAVQQFTEYRLEKLELDLERHSKEDSADHEKHAQLIRELELSVVALKVKLGLYAALGACIGSGIVTVLIDWVLKG